MWYYFKSRLKYVVLKYVVLFQITFEICGTILSGCHVIIYEWYVGLGTRIMEIKFKSKFISH